MAEGIKPQRVTKDHKGSGDMRALADVVRQHAYELHLYLSPGFLEKVYENGLMNRLQKAGLCVAQQVPVQVRDEDGTPIGEFIADLLVDNRLLVEVKAVRTLDDIHVAQVMNYLRATALNHALLINFGSQKFQIRKLAL